MNFSPTNEQTTTALRRFYNGMKSEYLAALVESAVTMALNNPEFQVRVGSLGVENLKQMYEE